MKILLIGDYSAFYKNLKIGLIRQGHQVCIATSGDKWKKITGDVDIGSNLPKVINRIDSTIKFFKYYKYMTKNDVVQIINPEVFFWKPTFLLVKYIKIFNKKFFMSACGDDYYYCDYCSNNFGFEYNPFMEKKRCELPFINEKRRTDFIIKHLDGIIPVLYDYAEPYRKQIKLKKTIPFPIDLDNIQYIENKVKNKVVIFHGLNREDFKGTEYIIEALKKIEKKYNDQVEIVIDGKMPLNDYLKVIDRVNIIIDQCKSYGYGMNAVYSMAKGKVVFSGMEKQNIKELQVEDCPIINIKPNIDDIYNKIEKFILNKNLINFYGLNSRKYVEKYHDCEKVAKMYLEEWNR